MSLQSERTGYWRKNCSGGARDSEGRAKPAILVYRRGNKLNERERATRAGGPERVEHVLQGLEKHGVTVVRGMGSFLRSFDAAAVYLTEVNRPGIIFVDDRTEYGDIVHEARHFAQDRRAHYPGEVSQTEALGRERDALLYELRNAKRWEYSDDETQRIFLPLLTLAKV